MRLGKGLRPDSADHPWRKIQRDARDILGGSHLGVVRAPGAVQSLRPFERFTFDQIGCEGCTGHSVIHGVDIVLKAAGAPLPFTASPGDPYKLGRCIGRVSPAVLLADDGAMLADVAQAISQWGIRPIGPLNPAGFTDVTTGLGGNVNVEPDLVELEADAQTLIVGEYRVDLSALTLIDDVCALLDAKIPLWVGGPVGPAYEGFTTGSAPVGAEPNGDGHATIVTGYWVNDDGSIDFDSKTSWSASFGDAGHVRVTSGWLRSMWDAYALTVRRTS